MKNTQFTLFAIILVLSTNLSSQEETTKETNASDKPHQFGITLKRTNYSYTPSEYFESKDSTFLELQKSGKLKNNSQITYPVSFLYYNKNWNLYTEASYFKISYGNMYYNNLSLDTFSFNRNDLVFLRYYDKVQNTITRREAKINFYTKTEINSSNRFFFGLGIRNIYKENFKFNYDPLVNDSKDSTNSYGLQAYLKYQVELASFVKLNVSAEPFYTYGNRNRSYQTPDYSSINYYWYSVYSSKAKNYFYGADLDFNFSFALNENLNLLVGYNYIYTKIRHEKNSESTFLVYDGQPQILYSIYQNSLIQQSHESKDHIFGYYFGLNAKF